MQTLRVGVAYPDPPFNGMPDDGGLDIDLMTAIADKLSVTVDFVPYQGADFDGIFDALNAGELVADGKAAGVRVYDYGDVRAALDDLTTGGCDAFVKLAPVLTELVKPFTDVEVVQRGISTENIAIAVGLADQELLARITVAQAEVEEDGTLQRIRRKWLGNPYADQSLGML